MSDKLKYIMNLDHDMQLRDYLKKKLNLSSRLIRGAAVTSRIFVNEKVVKLNQIVSPGDLIAIDINKDETQDITPEDIEIDIVYEDGDIIIVNKPINMVVHPTKSYQSGTLANALLYYFQKTGENCIVRLVNRLDMDTSGLIIIAKNQYSHMMLSRSMEKDELIKGYTAVIHGFMEEDKGTIDLPIYRVGQGTIKRIVHEDGQRSITHYNVQESLIKGQILSLRLETGRTHQIRVHLSHEGHPIYGDSLYGVEEDITLISRQALHASYLCFKHPRTGKEICLKSKLPKDILDLIEKLNV
ncbi:MAG TPA: RluA family pseudouridine synthase [Clostridiaceae bacterium]